MKVVLIGTGNVATVLGYRIKQAGEELLQVFGRTPAKVESLAHLVKAAACISYEAIDPSADIYLIAVSDKAIAEVASKLVVRRGALVVHTAGAVSKEVLAGISEVYAVLYPLQSLQAQRKDVPDIPLLLDANTPEAQVALETFARSISPIIAVADDAYRSRLHVAAVVTNNFTNYLYMVAQRYCINENLDFKLLQPLIRETVDRLQAIPPERSQTGPAVRGDQQTIDQHLDILKTYPDARLLYEQLTQHIQQWYGINK